MVEFEPAGIREDLYYAACLPELVRGALALDDSALAERLTAESSPLPLSPTMSSPPAAPSLPRPRVSKGEAAALQRGHARWRSSAMSPSGPTLCSTQGRCLTVLGSPEADEPLREARELFASMG